jgi:glutamate/tyrosine decarboxylase-like PLP-dependent enzyme
MSGSQLPPPPEALFPDNATRLKIEDKLSRALLAAAGRVASGSVMPTIDREQFRRELAQFDFATPRALEELLTWTIERMEHGVVHMNHPRYFGLFNPAANFPSQCADRIAGSFNPQLASSGSSPAPVDIEAHVIRAFARRAGLPEESVGHFATSGSEANYTALLCALTRGAPRFSAEGVRAYGAPVAMYTSHECQPAWFKIVHQAGIGREALRLIGTDGQGRLSPQALAAQIAADKRRGIIPLLISSTAGTTGAGMVDPLTDCAEIAQEHGIWHHVDAAWGGAALVSERLRGLLAGIERADSVTIDAHKWFATTMGCGMYITRDPQILSETFTVAAEFMPSSVTQLDPYLNTVQWSRRFLGLRLFLSLASAGWQGYAEHVERAVAVTALARTRLTARGWQAANASQLAVLCVLPPPGYAPIRDIVKRVLGSGRAWVAVSKTEGREVIRICVTHGETSESDVDELVAALESRA